MIKWIKYHLGFLSTIKLGDDDYYVTYTQWWGRVFVYQYSGRAHTTVFQRDAIHRSLGSAQETRDLYLKQRKAKRLKNKVIVL